MRIYGKHIFRSIKKHPLQPIMIVAIVALCVAVMILSVALPINISRNERAAIISDEWTADFTITMKASSDRRILFDDDIPASVRDMADYVGEFSLTGFAPDNNGGKSQVQIGAFDLVDADSFFEIRYLEYGKFTNNNIDTSAIVSERLAKQLGISLGDVLTVNVLGESLSYTVEGIARNTGIFKSKDVLVDMSGVRRILAERSALIASVSSDFNPYTKIHVKVKDGVILDEFKKGAEDDVGFLDKKLERYGDGQSENFYASILTATIVIPGALLVVISIMMIASTFELLQKKRHTDNTLFRMAGADLWQLNLLTYFESLIYAIFGGVMGCALAMPMMGWLNSIYSFKWYDLKFDFTDALIGVASAILITSIATFLHIKKQILPSLSEVLAEENVDTDRAFTWKKLLLLGPVVGLLVCALLFKPTARYPFAFAILLFAVAWIYVILPHIIALVFSLVSHLLEKKRKCAANLILAAKSCINSYPLKHAGRVMTLLVTVFISLVCVTSAVDEQMIGYVEFGAFDYIGMYVDDVTRERLEEIEGVICVTEASVDRNVVITEGKNVNGISASEYSSLCFNDTILPGTVPKGDQLVLSRGAAAMIGAKVGDRVECTIADIPCTLTLIEIVSTHGDFAFYDAEYLGAELPMTCIRTDGRVETAEAIISLFDERGIECIIKDDFFGETYDRVDPQLAVFDVMISVMVFITVIGVVNILAEQRMARLHEFEIMRQNGMTTGGVIRLQATEILYLAVVSLVSSAIFAIFIYAIINMAAVSFGMSLYA